MPLSLTYCRIFWSSSKDFDLCESRNSSGVQHQKSIIPPQSDLLEVRNRLKRPDRPAARPFSHIPSKTACRGFDSFCPCHEKSPKPRVSGLFCTFSAGMCFADRGRRPNDALNVVSGGIRSPWFRLVQHHFSIKEGLPGSAKRRPGEFGFSAIHSSNPAVMPTNRPVSFFT